jgi:hypothetical protein
MMVPQNPKPYLANSSLWEPPFFVRGRLCLCEVLKSWFDVSKSCSTNFDISNQSVVAEVDVSKGVLLQRVVLIGISKQQDSRSRIAVFDIPKDAVASFDILKAVGASFDISKDVGSEFWHLKKQKDFEDHEKQMWHLENSQT